VWATLALAATRTSSIKLGPGVLVPSLRHPMVNAAAIAQLAQLAPGRVQVAVGAGFTGRMTLGQRSLPWTKVREYVEVLTALLKGGTPQWEGAAIRMMHPDGFAPARPIDVPLLLGADGPKGDAAARDLADGIFTARHAGASVGVQCSCSARCWETARIRGQTGCWMPPATPAQ
jgi:5,10-methylenetetrahydromethanopterin reductase